MGTRFIWEAAAGPAGRFTVCFSFFNLELGAQFTNQEISQRNQHGGLVLRSHQPLWGRRGALSPGDPVPILHSELRHRVNVTHCACIVRALRMEPRGKSPTSKSPSKGKDEIGGVSHTRKREWAEASLLTTVPFHPLTPPAPNDERHQAVRK